MAQNKIINAVSQTLLTGVKLRLSRRTVRSENVDLNFPYVTTQYYGASTYITFALPFVIFDREIGQSLDPSERS